MRSYAPAPPLDRPPRIEVIYIGRGPEPGKTFSKTELQHLAIGGGAIFAAWLLSDTVRPALFGYLTLDIVIRSLLIGGLGLGTGFFLHEFAHKFAARHYGCWAEFRRAKTQWLAITLLISISGWFIGLPGAVVTAGNVDRRKNGIISAVGPVTNLAVALAFLAALYLLLPPGAVFLAYLLGSVVFFNAFLGAFNMLPVELFPGVRLDGYKVLEWSKPVYGALMGALAGLVVLLLFGVI
jgi:Zn-dependent protease